MKIKCEVCGNPFVSHREKSRKQSRFCSWACRIKSKDKHITCLECGIVFRVPASIKKRFCSRKCANVYNHKNKPSKKSIFTCDWCKKEFTEWTYRKPKFCSNKCKSEYGGSIRGIQLYKPERIIGRGMNWKKQAKLARIRDDYTCQVCGKNGWIDKFKVQVHHIIPYRLFNGDWEKANDLSNLVSLCPSCHPRVEAGIVKLRGR